MRLRNGLLVLAAALGLQGAAGAQTPAPALTLEDHALAGRIWDTGARRFVDRDALVARLEAARFVLLGETHDNPEHHRIQLALLDAMMADGARPALAMEQFDAEHQPAIDAAQHASNVTPDALATAGGFDRKGWDWPLYEPLVAAAIRADVPLVAANLSRATARRMVAEGPGVLGTERLARLGFDAVWSEQKAQHLQREIVDGHCGHVPPNLLPGLINAQRARDAVIAEALAPYAQRGAVVILGTGHARKDIGVPLYLSHVAPGADIVSVGLVEVESGRDAAELYAQDEGGPPAFDYLWFTPRPQRQDPCSDISPEAFGREKR